MKTEEKKNKYSLAWIYAQTKGVRRYFVILALAGVALAAINIGMTRVLQSFVDIATGDAQISLGANTLFAILFLLLEGAMSLVTAVSYQVAGNRMGKKLRLDLAGRLYRSDLQAFQKYHAGEFMTNLTADVESVSNCVPTLIRDTVGNALSAVLAILYLFLLNWKLALILLICIPLLIFCVAVFSPLVQKMSKADRENEEGIRVYLQDVLEKIAIFKICGMGGRFRAKAAGLLDAKVSSARRLGAAQGGSSFLNNVMGTAMFLIAMGGGAYFVTRGELMVSAMIAVVQLCNYIIWPFTAIGDIISNVNQSIVSAERLDRIYALPADPSAESSEEKKNAQPRGARIAGLRLEGVTFGYDGTEVLKGASAAFESGKVVGIVGESGGGKSTLLKLISGLYRPASGRIEAVFADSATSENLRPHIGLVPAEDLIFRDTIEANICMAKEPEQGRLDRSAASANIGKYIDSLDARYQTVIGDGKAALSSGQAQRIAIARVLYQEAEILLFDEPTANLDAESIGVFLETLRAVSKGRVCIVVTHDPRVAASCDSVLELKDGALAARAAV